MKKQDEIKTKEDVIDFIEWYISYRGGMGNRIDAFDILEHLKGKQKRHYNMILKYYIECSANTVNTTGDKEC